MNLASGVKDGKVLALARLISLIEDGDERAVDILAELRPVTGHSHIIGITGPPGAGKSTLADRLIKRLRARHKTAGVLAVDPTSSLTGGALLGDRTRMQDLATDPGVFIRSMATRGSLGGLARAVHDAITAIEAFGKDYIFLETVGVGQSEIDVRKMADTVVVIFVPGLGDDIQAIKAGITEIGDVLVVNKSDLHGAERVKVMLERNLRFAHFDDQVWQPPVLMTSAEKETGLETLLSTLDEHHRISREAGLLHERRYRRHHEEVRAILRDRLDRHVQEILSQRDEPVGSDSPHAVADEIWKALRNEGV